MRILRGLTGRILSCGCLAGVYETYEAEVVSILDEREPSCSNPTHRPGNFLPDASPSVWRENDAPTEVHH